VSQQYIWTKEPKNKKAVELVYYASFDAELTDISVYFGLSVARDQQSDKVLKRLVDICMSDIYTGRILWGTKGKHDKMLTYLEPYLGNPDVRVRERAAILEKVFRGEANYEEWEAEQFRRTRQEKFGEKLGAIRTVLLKGSSRQRRDVFGLVKREGLGVLFDESFIEALKACLRDRDPVVKEMAIGFGRELLCKGSTQDREMLQLMSELAKDKDSKVRQQAAVFVGSCWIWRTKSQSAEAIEIILLLSKDSDREVRNAAVYYGLSVVTNKSDEVIKRLLDMAVEVDGQADLGRITWGLQGDADKRKIMAQLQPLLSLKDKKGELARKVYFEIFKEELETEAVVF
jgi:HEAT repeat protein